MPISITRLRADLYKIIDQVIATGRPIELERKGHIVKIVPEKPKSKLDNLTSHPKTILVDPDELVHSDWSKNWGEGKNL
jgi:hypothetical protein